MITAPDYMIEKIERLSDKTGISIETRRPLEQHDNESLFALMVELLAQEKNWEIATLSHQVMLLSEDYVLINGNDFACSTSIHNAVAEREQVIRQKDEQIDTLNDQRIEWMDKAFEISREHCELQKQIISLKDELKMAKGEVACAYVVMENIQKSSADLWEKNSRQAKAIERLRETLIDIAKNEVGDCAADEAQDALKQEEDKG